MYPQAILRTLSVDVSNVPLLCLYKRDQSGRKYFLNAYALDFYKHGSLFSLASDNWYDCSYFNMLQIHLCVCVMEVKGADALLWFLWH